jgi:hypothetical protein
VSKPCVKISLQDLDSNSSWAVQLVMKLDRVSFTSSLFTNKNYKKVVPMDDFFVVFVVNKLLVKLILAHGYFIRKELRTPCHGVDLQTQSRPNRMGMKAKTDDSEIETFLVREERG